MDCYVFPLREDVPKENPVYIDYALITGIKGKKVQVFCTRKGSSLLLLFSGTCLAFSVSFVGREVVLRSGICTEYDIVHKGESTQVFY